MKKIFCIFTASLILITFSTPPVAAQVYTPEFVRFSLDNGLDVILHRDTTTASVSVNIAYHAGSACDPKGKEGLANICGSIVVLGSENVSYRDMLRLQYFTAAKIAGKTTADLMTVSSTFPAQYLDAALWVEADRMKNGYVPVNDKIVQSVAGSMVAQRRKSAKDPLSGIDEKIYEQLYPKGHPYRHMTYGDTVQIKKINAKDAKAFITRYYVPANAALTVAGNFDPEEARALIQKHFAGIPAGKKHTWGKIPKLSPLGLASIVKEDLVSVSRMYIIVPTVPRSHPDAPVLDFLAKYLAGTVNAWLQKRVVDQNPYVLAAEAVQNSRELDGNFWIVLNCSFEARMKEILTQVRHELNTLATVPLEDAELNEARNYTKMLYNLVMEDPFGLGGRTANMNGDALIDGSPLFLSTMVSAQLRISPEQMQAAIKKYFSFDDVLVLTVVPRGVREKGVVFE